MEECVKKERASEKNVCVSFCFPHIMIEIVDLYVYVRTQFTMVYYLFTYVNHLLFYSSWEVALTTPAHASP